MHLVRAAVDRYGPLADCRPPCEDGMTVFSGPNEAGKTLYLEALLQLLDPAVRDVMDPPPRVNDLPTGRVVVESGDNRHDCDGETALSDVSAVEPRHLQSVFVVRDSDLALPGEQAYYTSLIETLGDIHTSEIAAIQSALKERGRLTDRRLNVSSDQSHDSAGDVRDEAAALAEEVRAYVSTVEDEGLDALDARRLRLTRELREARDRLETQRKAQTVAEYERLSGQLETYQSTSTRLADLESLDRETLNELREGRNNLNRDRDDRETIESEIESTKAEIADLAASLENHQARESELQRRKGAVDDAKSALESFRDRQDDATGAERRLALQKSVTGAGLLAAGMAGGTGAVAGSLPAVGLGAVLLVTAIAGGVAHRRTAQRLAAVEATRESVLRTARDAGLDVEAVEAVAPAIEAFDGELSEVRDRVARTDQQLRDAETDLDDLQDRQSDLQAQISSRARQIDECLDAADVKSVEEYEDRVDTREDLESRRQRARQSLVDRFGDPDAEDPEETATEWEQALAGLVADVNVDEVDPETYDERALRERKADVERLDEKLAALEARLAEHDEVLEAFDERARDLETQPFIGRSLRLDSRSKGGLETLASDLDTVVQEIEDDAELSRKALAVFERIGAQEEQKLTELFDPEGPASRTFERVTGGRYTAVAYDASAHELVVERHDGRTLEPHLLSQGTRDQLYFASRVSLARQLLGADAGFLLLDDPFLAADPDRLRRGFETLQRLADDGWQILYFTAKQEVHETMVAEFDLAHERLEPISTVSHAVGSSR